MEDLIEEVEENGQRSSTKERIEKLDSMPYTAHRDIKPRNVYLTPEESNPLDL